MKKFWRSGMVDKKIVMGRERDEYINKLHRTILELSKPDVGDLINDTTDYDEIRFGDNVVLDFKDACTVTESKDPLRDIVDNYKNNIAGKQMSATEANMAFRETMIAFAKEVNKMENE